MNKFDQFFSNLKFIEKIGRGAFGEVNKVLRLTDNQIYAIKQSFSVMAGYEAQIMKQLNHPNLLKLIESYQIIQFSNRDFDVGTFMLIEYCPYDLHYYGKILAQQSEVEQKLKIKSIMTQVLQGLEYMHRLDIAHRDIKPDNILINNKFVVKICDFGMSEKLIATLPKRTLIQTDCYRAPEIIVGIPFYDVSIDMWSLGCTFFELVAHRILFNVKKDVPELDLIFEICGNFNSLFLIEHQHFFKNMSINTIPKRQLNNFLLRFNLSTNYIKLIDLLLQMNPKDRLTASQALEPQFLNLLD